MEFTDERELNALRIAVRHALREGLATDFNGMRSNSESLIKVAEKLDVSLPAWANEADFELDLEAALGKRMIADIDFAKDVYRAMCNTTWEHRKGNRYMITWRGAGDVVAVIRDKDEDYLDFYCSGNEGNVHPDVASAMAHKGWEPVLDE